MHVATLGSSHHYNTSGVDPRGTLLNSQLDPRKGEPPAYSTDFAAKDLMHALTTSPVLTPPCNFHSLLTRRADFACLSGRILRTLAQAKSLVDPPRDPGLNSRGICQRSTGRCTQALPPPSEHDSRLRSTVIRSGRCTQGLLHHLKAIPAFSPLNLHCGPDPNSTTVVPGPPLVVAL